jgi:transposase
MAEVDLHKATHTAVMVNCWGDKIEEITIEKRPADFDKLLKFTKKHTPVFGFEDVGGNGRSLAIYLLEKNQIVKEVNASLAHDRRKSNPMYRKNDSWDAQCVADVLAEGKPLVKLESVL